MDSKVKGFMKSTAEIVAIVATTFLVFTYVVKPINIEGSSMKPTIFDKDLAMVDAIGLKQNGVKRFDIVIVESERLNSNLIKRVIGLPGETIEFKNDQLYVNGNYTPEPFLDQTFMETSKLETNKDYFTSDFKITLMDDEYFVMGDNRLHSEDSRALGPFKRDDFMGKNGFVIFPFNHFGWLNNVD